ncbi:UNVERIFIED_CONTAM: hypothetical protein FKN15_002085 [Acipenser sinensis]
MNCSHPVTSDLTPDEKSELDTISMHKKTLMKDIQDKEPRGIIPLENLCVKEVEDPRKSHCLELFNPNSRGQKIKACKTETDGRVVEGKHQSYKISASSAEEREQWIKSIRASITKHPFYDLVSVRKRKVISKGTSE